MDELKKELIALICDVCNLPEIDFSAFKTDEQLIGPDGQLGIDSIDALEIVVAVQKEYGIRIDSENTSREVLQTLDTLADYIVKEGNG